MSDLFALGIDEPAHAIVEPMPGDVVVGAGLSTILPENFPLLVLLRFLPDVRLKQRLDAAAAEATAIDVRTSPERLAYADQTLATIRAGIAEIDACFREPTSLANQLHKRLTGLRADFTKAGDEALAVVGRRIHAETQRLEALAEQARRAAQAEADRKAREDAERIARDAAKAKAPKAVVEQLRAAAATATASPVPTPQPAPRLEHSTTAANWKARLAGTPDDAEPNPEIAQLSVAQQQQVREICAKVAAGALPLATIAGINWPMLNQLAKAQKHTFAVEGFEAFNAGSLRGKPRR